MNVSFKALGLAGALLLAPVLAPTVQAVPLLQLDIQGGVYDPVTETIVAPGGSFTVYAILTPQNNAKPADIAALLNQTYYISAALSPQIGPPGATLGSFTMGPAGGTQTTVSATSGMTYGVPPLDAALLAAAGNLAPHSIYPTYFSEFSFQFSALNKATTYNTMDNPGGPTADPNGKSYYAAFTGDSSLLSAFALHFDLYSQSVKNCANTGNCSNLAFAPFSHDAELTRVPEAGSMLVMLSGLAMAVGTVRQRAARK